MVIFCLQALLAAPRLSSTADEPIHLMAGYSYWQTRDFGLNPEHPPLAKLLAALPLLAIGPDFDASDKTWKTGIESAAAADFLYRNNADRLLFWGRVPLILLAALGGLVTFLWARDLFGPAAGMVAGTCACRTELSRVEEPHHGPQLTYGLRERGLSQRGRVLEPSHRNLHDSG